MTGGPAGRERALAFIARMQRNGRPAPPPSSADAMFARGMELARAVYPDASDAELERRVRESIRREEDRRATRLPHESSGFQFVIDRLSDAIDRTARAAGAGVDRRPIFAGLDTGDLNAVTARVPGTSEHVVFLESELLIFASLYGDAIAHAVPCDGLTDEGLLAFSFDEDRISERVRADPDLAERFADVVLGYVVDGTVTTARPRRPARHHANLAGVLRDSMTMFVVGHEYGHIIAGHLHTAGTSKGVAHDPETKALAYSWGQEFEADELGLRLAIPAMHDLGGVDLNLSFWGADLFFSALTVIDTCVYHLMKDERRSGKLGSHPPAELRLGRLHHSLVDLIGEERATGPIEFTRRAAAVTHELWVPLRWRLEDLRAAGKRPAEKWLRRRFD